LLTGWQSVKPEPGGHLLWPGWSQLSELSRTLTPGIFLHASFSHSSTSSTSSPQSL